MNNWYEKLLETAGQYLDVVAEYILPSGGLAYAGNNGLEIPVQPKESGLGSIVLFSKSKEKGKGGGGRLASPKRNIFVPGRKKPISKADCPAGVPLIQFIMEEGDLNKKAAQRAIRDSMDRRK
jgi:hypothetical protein